MKVFGLVVCFLCVNFLDASTTYKAGMYSNKIIKTEELGSMVNEAAKSGVDILVLPSLSSSVAGDNYDEMVKILETAAKETKMYLVAHLHEKSRCQNNVEIIRSSLVFDRAGSLISVYRKPVSNLSNCTTSPSDLISFQTDFGVTFGLLMDEDIIVHNLEYMKGLKNFVISGEADGMLFKAAHFFSSWSYVNNANLVSCNGIYAGKGSFKTFSEKLVTADLDVNAIAEHTAPVINFADVSSEDLSQYSVQPLNLETSAQGYEETVCFRAFCCEFYVKTRVTGDASEVSYKMTAFEGVSPFTNKHNIGVQSCMLFACAGNEGTCELGPNYSTNVIFEKLSIAANFTKQSAQYPIIQSAAALPTEQFKFSTKHGISTLVTTEVIHSQNILKFGIFGRDFSKDFISYNSKGNSSQPTNDFYEFIYNENVQEWFDYVWIRLRILLVVVSLYVLEMM